MLEKRCGLTEIPEAFTPHVSVENEFPADLYESMVGFIEQHPQWDHYRLMQSALAGFLFQQGYQDKAVVRHYLDGLFRRPDYQVPPSCSDGSLPTPDQQAAF